MDPIHIIPNDHDDADDDDDDDDAFVTPAEAEILERALVRGTPTEVTDADFETLMRWAHGVRFRAATLDLLLKGLLIARIDPDGKVRFFAECFFPRHGEISNPPG